MANTTKSVIEEVKNKEEKPDNECWATCCVTCCSVPYGSCDTCADTWFTIGLNCFCLMIGGFFESIAHAICFCNEK